MAGFEFISQPIYNRLVGRNVLLMIKSNFSLIEVTIVEITQHRFKVKVINKPNAVVMGVRKVDVVLFPIKVPRNKLKKIIKNSIEDDKNLTKYIEQFAYRVSK